ncbi:MAG: sulfotransferase [Hellea sp.]
MNKETFHNKISKLWQYVLDKNLLKLNDALANIKLTDVEPGLSMSTAQLGAMYCIVNQYEKGKVLLEQDWSDAEPNAAGLAGAMLLSRGKFTLAEKALRQAVDKKASDTGAHQTNLGRAIFLQGRPEDALVHLDLGVLNAKHDKVVAVQSQCEALLALDRADEALDLVSDNLEEKQMVMMQVTLLSIANRHDEAIEILSNATESKYSDDIELLLLTAEIISLQGKRNKAMRMLQKAKALEPDNINILCRIIHHGHKMHISDINRNALQELKAIVDQKDSKHDITPELQALVLESEAFILMSDNDQLNAELKYKEALSINAQMPAALSGLGQLYLETGRVEEAKTQFELLRAVAPMMGWSQLINVREVPDDPAVLEQMEILARQPSLEGPMRYSLLLSISSAWDKKGSYDKAMKLALEANEAATHHLSYDPDNHRHKINKIISRYSPTFCESRKDFGSPSRVPVFVLGMPRSGTTLTEQILSGHSQVYGAGEIGVISEIIAKMEAWQSKLGSRLRYPESVSDISPHIAKGYAQYILEILKGYDSDALHVIDKMPHNFENIGLIKLLFPNAVIFHCRRDPKDIAISNFMTDYAAKHGGMGFAYNLDWIGQQLVDHERIMQHWHNTFPGQIMEVVYEDLIEDTNTIAKKMIQFLNLTWEDSVLSHQDLDRTVRTASVWQVRQPVYKTSKQRWKRYEKWLQPLDAALQEEVEQPSPMPLPSLEPSLFTKGTALLNQSRVEEALECFEKILVENPRHAAAYHFLGAAQFKLGMHDDAVINMRKSVKLLPLHTKWFENLANVEASLGNKDKANNIRQHVQKLNNKVNHVSR